MDKIEGCVPFLLCCLPVRKVVCSTKGESGFKDRGLLVRLSDVRLTWGLEMYPRLRQVT